MMQPVYGPARDDPLNDNTLDKAGPAKWQPEWRVNDSNEDFQKEFNKVPLFMRTLDEEGNNTAIEAIQALVYDGTPEEVASNFRNQGNESYREKRYRDAVEYYTKAIAAKSNDIVLVEACYSNRAACNLVLKNYGSVIRDCANVLKMNPQNVKALYRSGKALFHLDRLQEAADCVSHATKLETNNSAVMALSRDIEIKIEHLKRRENEKKEKEMIEKERERKLKKVLVERGITMIQSDKPPSNPNPVHIHPDTLNHDSPTVIWPVFFLYPEYKESDFIQEFSELDTFAEHIDVVFGQLAPWDSEKKYNPDNVEIYFEVKGQKEESEKKKDKLVRVGKNVTLEKVLSRADYVVMDGIPSFIVLSKTGKFREIFLENYK